MDEGEESSSWPTKQEEGRMRKRKQQNGSTTARSTTSTSVSMNDAVSPTTKYGMSKTMIVTATAVVAMTITFFAYRLLPFLLFLRIFTLLPVGLCIFPIIQKGKQLHQRIIPASLVLAVVSAQLPTFAAAAIAVVAVIIFTLMTEPVASNNNKTVTIKPRSGPDFTVALSAIVLMIAVLLIENFLIWVVSATFPAGQHVSTAPPPLQDNGQLLLQNHVFHNIPKRNVIGLRRMWNTQWALVASLAASLFVAETYHTTRTLFSVATRAMATIAVARSIRTVSFLLTVLPSQVHNCYAQRFPHPPPPTDIWEWIFVGLQPRSHGGCNDLIISGHATITATMACVATSVAAGDGTSSMFFAVALWSMLVLDYAVEIYEGFHYSVDMWLGMVLVILIWRVMGFVEANMEEKATTCNATTDSKGNRQRLSWRRAAVYSPPAIITYLQMTLLPETTANFVILAFVITCLCIFLRCIWKNDDEVRQKFYVHYVQHTFLCLLVLALGVYL